MDIDHYPMVMAWDFLGFVFILDNIDICMGLDALVTSGYKQQVVFW